jgi:hypothetical protein
LPPTSSRSFYRFSSAKTAKALLYQFGVRHGNWVLDLSPLLLVQFEHFRSLLVGRIQI